MFSKNEDNSFDYFLQETRRLHKVKSQRLNKDKVEIDKISDSKKKLKKSVETDTRKVNNLLKRRSSKTMSFNGDERGNKNINDYNEELIPDIIDPSYNFTLNYQLKETAINVLKSGIENDPTKIKFFSNYLYQLSPFNKIFRKLKQSKNIFDIYNLQKILYSLTNQLNYEYFEKNKIIFKNGDIPDKYYIILKGEVDIIVPNEIEVMMTEFEYFFYILRLYRFQEHPLLKKVLNKNYNLYPLNKRLLEDWIHTAYNTLRHLEQEAQLNKIVRKKKNPNKYLTSYKNAEDLFNHLEKQKKLNLLMKNKNVIILLEKIRMRNERIREAAKNGQSLENKKNKNKKNKIKNNNDEKNSQQRKKSIGYAKLDGQLKKIFMNDDQIIVAEKCANEVSQIIEILSEDFNMRKYLNELNRCNSEKYLTRVEPYFFDEDTNEKLDSKLFIVSRNADNPNLVNENKTEEKLVDIDDIRIKLQNLFNKNIKINKNKMKNSFFANRKKTIVYHYVLVNTLCTGETFGEMSNESIKKDEKRENINSQRISTIIPRENCHLASLKKILYNKILKEINENNLYQQFTFLFSLDLFKDCNKNNFMKNYINFFIKKVYRSNEIVFSQDEDLGEDRSIYFIEEGSFSSYCKMSVNDIEILFNNLHYDGLIPEDDAHEDNLFNKENHYFNKFKKKKIVFNLQYLTENDAIGFNDALYKGRYIYTVKCQSALATVYEIKLKFFNLILNSEPKLFQNVVHYEMVKRNLMIKFFLNAFNNKNNFYKFISFQNEENNREDKNIVHKNYFGKNPFRDSNEIANNISDRKNKSELKKLNTIQNKINDNYLYLLPKTERITSSTIYVGGLNCSNKNISGITHKNKIILRNRSKANMKNYICNTSRNKNNNFKDYFRNKTVYNEKNSNNIKNTINKGRIFSYKDKIDNNKGNSNSFELKIEEYQDKPKGKIVIPPIITNQINKNIHLHNKTKNLYNSLFSDNQENNNNINKTTKVKLFINKPKIESSFRSSNLNDNISKCTALKTESKSMNKYRKYLDTIENNVTLKNNDISKNEEIQLKCYLESIPDFFNKNNCKKNIFFGMNKKTLFQNNALFTEFK